MKPQLPNIKFKRILAVAFFLPILLLMILTGSIFWQMQQLINTLILVTHSEQVISQAHLIQTLLIDRETGIRGYLATHEPLFLEPYNRAGSLLPDAFDEFAHLNANNHDQLKKLTTLRNSYQDWDSSFNNLISKPLPQIVDVPLQVDGKNKMDAMRAIINDIIQQENLLRSTQVTVSEQSAKRTFTLSIIGTIALTILIAGLTRNQLLRLSQSYTTSMREAESFAKEFVEESRQLEQQLRENRLAKEQIEQKLLKLIKQLESQG